MATDDDYNDRYNNDHRTDIHHLRRDTRDAYGNSQLAKWLSIISLIVSAIALTVAVSAMNKAGNAESTANRAEQTVQQAR